MDTEIAELRMYPVREPVSRREYVVVRVKTRSGLTGWGECGVASSQDLEKARKTWAGRQATSYATAKTETPLDGAIDMALLDVCGKAANAPVYRILGGPTRNKARAFTTVDMAAVDRAWSAGYRAVGVEVPKPAARNQGQAYQLKVKQLAETLRQRGGDFVLDGGGALTAGDAASVAATVERLHPLWFDEPCLVSNVDTIRKISNETVVPLGFGRAFANPGLFQELLRDGLIDIVRPELARYGITGCRRISALAEPYYVAAAPHHDGGPIGTAAALHLAAALPNFFIQHIPLPEAEEDQRMRAEIAGGGLEKVTDGFAALPVGAGLGVNVNEAALEKYHAA